MHQYTNANGDTFGVTITENESVAFLEGKFVAKASTETELEEILDHISHANKETTMRYIGIESKKTAE